MNDSKLRPPVRIQLDVEAIKNALTPVVSAGTAILEQGVATLNAVGDAASIIEQSGQAGERVGIEIAKLRNLFGRKRG